MAALEAEGIPARSYFFPLHRMHYLRGTRGDEDLPVTESVASGTIALPFHGGLNEDQIDQVVLVLDRAVASVH